MTYRRRLLLAIALLAGFFPAAAAAAPTTPPPSVPAPAVAPPPRAAPPQPVACVGTDLIAQLKQQDPGAYQKFLEKAGAIANGDGLLWSITKPGAPTSYLFGTFHSADDGAVAIARSLAPFIAKTPTVATELGDFNETVVGIKLGLRLLASKVSAHDLIASQKEREKIGAFLKRRSLDPAVALKMPPWVLMTAISFPPCEIERQRRNIPIVDKTVVELGKKAGAKIVGLETVEEQADAMESIDPKFAIHMVEMMASKATLADDSFATLTARYREHRPGDMLPWFEAATKMTASDAEANRAFMVTIVEKRNVRMAQRARPLIDKGAVLIAVGALHLVGKQGLVELLRKDGYTLGKVW